MTIDLQTGPSVEPLDLATVKLWARIDGNDLDLQLPMMIAAARQVAEQQTGTKLVNQVWRASLTDWPAPTDLFPLFPVSSLTATYFNGATWMTLPPMMSTFYRSGFSVVFDTVPGAPLPALGSVAGPRVRLDWTVGYGPDATFVPQAIRQFCAAHVAAWVRNPEASSERYAYLKSPFLDALIDPFTVFF